MGKKKQIQGQLGLPGIEKDVPAAPEPELRPPPPMTPEQIELAKYGERQVFNVLWNQKGAATTKPMRVPNKPGEVYHSGVVGDNKAKARVPEVKP